jgi:hypothetical protein
MVTAQQRVWNYNYELKVGRDAEGNIRDFFEILSLYSSRCMEHPDREAIFLAQTPMGYLTNTRKFICYRAKTTFMDWST